MRSVSECYRGKSVRVFRLDRDGTIARLRERAKRLLAASPDVVEVRLVGSLARGDARPGSDADLLVLLTDAHGSLLDRAARLAPYFAGAGVGCDVLAYTEAEWAQLQRERRRIVGAADAEGIVLARRGEGIVRTNA